MDAFRQLDLRGAASTLALASEVVTTCRHARLVLVRTNTDDGSRREFWDDLLSSPSIKRISVDEKASSGEPTDNLWSNIEFDPQQPHRFRHSNSAQPLHTDGAYVDDSPPLVLMFCQRPAVAGGATLFLDGPQLVRLLSLECLPLFSALRTVPILFRKGNREIESTVISQDANGPLLRWNYYALSPSLGDRARVIADEFQAFLHELTRRAIPRAIQLRQGDAVLFRDDRLLHGRESFVAKVAGERCLWKSGLRI